MHPPGTSIYGTVPPGTIIPNLPVYGSGFLHNSPDLNSSVIYALNLGKKNVELMREYPNRDYYLWKYDPGIDNFKLMRINEDKNR